MAALFNDGSVPYGSVVVTINGVAYVAENIQDTNPTSFIERRNELNEPSGGVTIQDFVTGSATLQLATSGTTVPTNGLTFAYASATFYLTQVERPLAQGETKKVNISFRKQIN